MNLNKVFVLGNLTRDPDVKSLPSGQLVANFGMATNRFFVDKSGQKQQQTEFHNIVAFGKLADIISRFLTKGSLVLVEGRLQTRNWQDSSGNQRYKTEIIAQGLQLGPKFGNRSATPKTTDTTETEKETATEKETPETTTEEIPVIEEEEINVKDIPF